MRSRIGDESGSRQDCVLQLGDIGVTAEDHRVGGDELPIEIGQKLVRIKPADDGQNARHHRVCEGIVQIFDP